MKLSYYDNFSSSTWLNPNGLQISTAPSPARSRDVGDGRLQPYACDLDGEARPGRLRDLGPRATARRHQTAAHSAAPAEWCRVADRSAGRTRAGGSARLHAARIA